jgi:hypothetical protein
LKKQQPSDRDLSLQMCRGLKKSVTLSVVKLKGRNRKCQHTNKNGNTKLKKEDDDDKDEFLIT